ncbi:MBL fold metallo-hydrolase [Ideonella sp. A 288]|uniref:MBL fold metallo-hydrolase n=1 Tax=Ideonella sp. A 288 TaxID=1962181 RepID=UPI000B4BF217|nr:MBL fold metallo-hydrolase [Ideonella sp. A 288]
MKSIEPRRRFLQHTLAAAGLASATPLFAAAPMAGGTALSVHRMKLGAFEVTSVLDGFIELPPTVLQGDPALLERTMKAGGLAGGPIRTAVNCFLVNTGARLVMIDCGGAKMLGPTAGRMPQALAQLGIDPGQVDEVYITHMHGDHLHGAVTPEGAKVFPNAVLRISKPDVDYWASPAVEAAAPENQKGRFVAAKRAVAAYGDRLQTFELGAELTPGIRSVPAVGHTPGHSCYMVGSGDARLLLLGDTLHVAPVQFARPEVTVMFDFRQEQARTLRQDLFEMAAKENILIGAVHLPFPGIGRLRHRDGGGYVYDALPWQMY